jgi:large subunit ribosomal protein L17
VFSYLQDKEAVSELFREIAGKVVNRPGGYTRILKTGNRIGDNAEMCIIELVDYNENMLSTSEKAKAKGTRRGRRAGGKKTTETSETKATEPAEVKGKETAEAKAKEPAETKAKEHAVEKKAAAKEEGKVVKEEKEAPEKTDENK